MFPGAAAFAFRRHHTTGFVIADKTAVVIRLLLFLLRAGVDRVEVGNRLIRQIRPNHEADAAVGRAAETVDLAFERWLHLKDCASQRLALDEVVGKLVERSVKVIVGLYVSRKGADQNFPVEPVILIERKTSALADQDAVRFL